MQRELTSTGILALPLEYLLVQATPILLMNSLEPGHWYSISLLYLIWTATALVGIIVSKRVLRKLKQLGSPALASGIWRAVLILNSAAIVPFGLMLLFTLVSAFIYE
jgi:hypothetical protein